MRVFDKEKVYVIAYDKNGDISHYKEEKAIPFYEKWSQMKVKGSKVLGLDGSVLNECISREVAIDNLKQVAKYKISQSKERVAYFESEEAAEIALSLCRANSNKDQNFLFEKEQKLTGKVISKVKKALGI